MTLFSGSDGEWVMWTPQGYYSGSPGADKIVADKRLLQAASVIGKDVPLAMLEAIAEMPERALRESLARLQAAEFLYETRLFPEAEYTFKHALTHEVTYGSLLQERRRRARALGSLYLSTANEGCPLFVKAISVLQVQMEQMSMETSLQVIPQEFADRERGLFDIRGFLAGLVLSWAIGAVLYIYLTVT